MAILITPLTKGEPMSETVDDPLHRARYSFRREGENRIVDTWLGGRRELPKHYHPVHSRNWQWSKAEFASISTESIGSSSRRTAWLPSSRACGTR